MADYDLTHGPIFKSMSLFALPLLCGNILQQMYNMVDTWVVGRYAGADALASIGSAFTLMTFLTSILIGLCMGSSVVFSMCFGKKDEEGLVGYLQASFLLIAFVALLLTVIPAVLLRQIIVWMNIPFEIRPLIANYLRIVFFGMPAVFFYNFFSSYLRARGNSMVPLGFLIVSSVLNIVLDLLFVAVFNKGVAGAAYATVIAQYAAGLAAAFYVLKKSAAVRRSMNFKRINLKRTKIKTILSYSGFTCLQQSVMNLGILCVQGIVNQFGTSVMAAFAAAVKIDAFAYMPAQEYGNAFSTFTAQNMGAGDSKRVMRGIKCAFLTSISYCIIASVVLWNFAKPLMRFFVSASEPEIVSIGVQYLHIEGAFYCGIGMLFLFYGLYRAIGKPVISLLLTIISLGSRVLIAAISSGMIGVTGIWWAVPIGWGLADLVGALYFVLKGKKEIEREKKKG